MSVYKFRRQTAGAVLRGPVLEWWLDRKLSRLEGRYAAELAGASGKPAPKTPVPLKSGDPLRRILFITDCVWEQGELIPELALIAELRTLDLAAALKSSTGPATSPGLVVTGIREFIATQSGFEPDVILFYARSSLLSDEAFELLRQRWSCPVLGMNLDEKMEFLDYGVFSSGNDNYQRWARKDDLNLSNVRAVVDWYADAGLPVMFMAEGYHPKVSGPPQSIAEFRHPLSFVGSCRPERQMFVRRLQALGVTPEISGYGWPDSGSVKDPVTVYRSSMINLGIGLAAPSQTLTTLKGRDFECPGAGACYLTTYNWELGFHYDIGREILCYRSEAELAEMYSFYRRRPEDCLAIAQAAYRRCLAEHTWEKRFRDVFQKAGFRLTAG